MIQVFSTRKDKPHAYEYGDLTSPGFDPIEFAISPDGVKWVSEYDQADLDGVYCYKAPDVQPANQTDNLKKIGLIDGSRLLSTSYSTRELKMELIFEGVDENDAELAYDALQRFLVSRSPYWICFANWPQRMYYVRAKVAAPTFAGNRAWTCEVAFTDLIGLSRSIATSVNYQDNNGFGNNMPIEPEHYTFTSNHFFVDNQSDTIIDPERRGHPFVLTLEGHSDGKMTITNKTTGEKMERCGRTTTSKNGQTTSSDSHFDGTWKLDGVRKTLNGKSDEMQCEYEVFTLQPGENEFQIDNFTGKVTFDFPFWWLS